MPREWPAYSGPNAGRGSGRPDFDEKETYEMLTDIIGALTPAAADPIIGISDQYFRDPRPEKVNLTVGNYLNARGCIPLQATAAKAEARLLERRTVHSYLPQLGLEIYCREVEKITFGEASPARLGGRVVTCQAVGGTGALYLGGIFARETLGVQTAAVSDPTWGNHISLFAKGGLSVAKYAYYDKVAGDIAFNRLIDEIRALPERTLVLLHVCCHNPTGMDLNREQWRAVADVVRERDHLAFLDMAYQGFAQGLEEDAYPVRLFEASGMPFLVAVSLSKGLSLYGERTGALHIVLPDARQASTVKSLIKKHIRALYSNPPAHGARIAAEVFGDPELKREWVAEVDDMRNRVYAMRRGLDALGREEGVVFDFALKQHGIFSFTGFTAEEMRYLRSEHGVYGIDSGRIAMAGLTEPVLAHVARAFADVIKRRK